MIGIKIQKPLIYSGLSSERYRLKFEPDNRFS